MTDITDVFADINGLGTSITAGAGYAFGFARGIRGHNPDGTSRYGFPLAPAMMGYFFDGKSTSQPEQTLVQLGDIHMTGTPGQLGEIGVNYLTAVVAYNAGVAHGQKLRENWR